MPSLNKKVEKVAKPWKDVLYAIKILRNRQALWA